MELCGISGHPKKHGPMKTTKGSRIVLARLLKKVVAEAEAVGELRHRRTLIETFGLPANKVVATRNGFCDELIPKPNASTPRDWMRSVYSSTPYRGLRGLLRMFPHLRARVPALPERHPLRRRPAGAGARGRSDGRREPIHTSRRVPSWISLARRVPSIWKPTLRATARPKTRILRQDADSVAPRGDRRTRPDRPKSAPAAVFR